MRKNKKNTSKIAISATPVKKNKIIQAVMFLAGSGLLAMLMGYIYNFCTASTHLEFIQPVGRSYEFQLKNDTSTERFVKRLRVYSPNMQKLIYTTTEDVYASKDVNGNVTLPGGNTSYIPAFEFKELDGQVIAKNSALKFRIPPLSSKSWLEPSATIIGIKFEASASNFIIATIEGCLDKIKLITNSMNIKYLVINNYWEVTSSNSTEEAIRVFCRDTDTLQSSKICK